MSINIKRGSSYVAGSIKVKRSDVYIAASAVFVKRAGVYAPAGVGGGGALAILTVDERGWPSSYSIGGVTKRLSWGPYGIASITGTDGGVQAYAYSAAGVLTGITHSTQPATVPSLIERNGASQLTAFTVAGTRYPV